MSGHRKNILLRDVRVLSLQPNDIVVFRLDREATPEIREQIHDAFKTLLPGHRCVVLAPGQEIEVLRP